MDGRANEQSLKEDPRSLRHHHCGRRYFRILYAHGGWAGKLIRTLAVFGPEAQTRRELAEGRRESRHAGTAGSA